MDILEKDLFELNSSDLKQFDVVVNAFGSASLFVNEEKTIRLFETAQFPKEYLATAANQSENLKDLQNTEGVKWRFISPAVFFNPAGKRTGSYKKGKDNLIVNAKGESHVSYADFAML